jgi:hypothetical protein
MAQTINFRMNSAKAVMVAAGDDGPLPDKDCSHKRVRTDKASTLFCKPETLCHHFLMKERLMLRCHVFVGD